MKLLFVRPNPSFTGKKNPHHSFFEKLFIRLNMFAPFLTLQVLARVTPKEYSVKIIDERYEKIDSINLMI